MNRIEEVLTSGKVNKLNTIRARVLASTTAAIVLASLVVSAPGIASTAPASDVIVRQGSSAAETTPQSVKYSDTDVVGLLVFGKGRIAEERPDLANKFDVGLKDSEVPEGAIDDFTEELRAVDEDFHEQVTVKVQINDAKAAQSAVERLRDDIDKIAEKYDKEEQASKRSIEPQGKGKFKTNYVVASNIVAGRDVVVAVELALAAYVAGVAVVAYKFDDSQPTSLELEETYKELADL